jgi:hypothetical protein
MKELKPLIIHLPFVILLINGISFIFSLFNKYFIDYWWVLEFSSHGLLTVFYMLFYAYYNRLCSYTIICIATLGVINVLNIAHYFLDLEYHKIYVGILIITGIIFSKIKWKTQL